VICTSNQFQAVLKRQASKSCNWDDQNRKMYICSKQFFLLTENYCALRPSPLLFLRFERVWKISIKRIAPWSNANKIVYINGTDKKMMRCTWYCGWKIFPVVTSVSTNVPSVGEDFWPYAENPSLFLCLTNNSKFVSALAWCQGVCKGCKNVNRVEMHLILVKWGRISV